MTSTGTNTIDITDSSKYANTQFSISLDAGPSVQVDIKQKTIFNPWTRHGKCLSNHIVFALQNELQRLFDDRITVSTSNGSFVINDEEGEELRLTKELETDSFSVQMLSIAGL